LSNRRQRKINVSFESEKRRLWIPAALGLSLVIHVVFFYSTEHASSYAPKVYGSSRVDFKYTPPAEKPPEPGKALPETQKAPPEKKKAEPASPKPNREAPEPPAEQPPEPPKQVFGVTDESVTSGNSGVAVRVGNTLEKKMEKKFTEKEDVKPLPPPRPEKKEKPKRPEPVPVYELTKTPSFRNKVEPVYPEEARRAQVEGIVQLEVFIDEKGRVYRVRVLKSPGHGLEKAAIRALGKSSFSPGFMGDKAVPVRIRIPYRFVLDG